MSIITEGVDWYLREVIGKGDGASEIFAQTCSSTLNNSGMVHVLRQGMNGIAVLKGIPEDHVVVVHSAVGDPQKTDVEEHAVSLVDRLKQQADNARIQPIAFANVVDAKHAEADLAKSIAQALTARANYFRFSILNGEYAVLGDLVVPQANISGTMVSIAPASERTPGAFQIGNDHYYAFHPKGKAVYLNSDGIGTKTRLYARAQKFELGLDDATAMLADDTAKLGAIAQVLALVVETKGNIPLDKIQRRAKRLETQLRAAYLLQHEPADQRWKGYAMPAKWKPSTQTADINESENAYNISGTMVSVIDEERLAHPLVPQAGDYLIAIIGNSNPRSNGITDKRRIMRTTFGPDWHLSGEGAPKDLQREALRKELLAYLTTPSTIFYPLFCDLIDAGIATAVFHNSGGAFDGKLARPLAAQGLFCTLTDLFEPSPQDLFFMQESETTPEAAYGKWPMGTEGFITTRDDRTAIQLIKSRGLEARTVGTLRAATGRRTGVELLGIPDSHGHNIYFSGKKEE